MAGTHYTLDRDKPKPEVPKQKTCKRCQVTKANTFDFFGKKLCGSRTTYATVDICKACMGAKMKAAHEERRSEKAAFEERQVQAIVGQVGHKTPRASS